MFYNTIALGGSIQERNRGSASEVIRLVHQRLLDGVVPHQNHGALSAQVHSQHGAVAFTELEVKHNNRQTCIGFLYRPTEVDPRANTP